MKTRKQKTMQRAAVREWKEPMPPEPPRWPRRVLTAGAVLLILHGIIELLPALLIFFPAAQWAPDFVFENLAANWRMTLGFSIVCGLLRIAAAAGILRNRLWGWTLGVLLCVITFAVLTLYLPMGVMDAVLAGPVLLLLLIGRFPETGISA